MGSTSASSVSFRADYRCTVPSPLGSSTTASHPLCGCRKRNHHRHRCNDNDALMSPVPVKTVTVVEQVAQTNMNNYNIKKKEEVVEQAPQEEPNPLMRKKKTPEELAAEAEQEDLDDFTKLKNSIETQVNEIKTQIEGKCSLQ
uniref:Uncharacterized protein n=1 Tax=Anopheles albimanus TaxID=7167 RepID=A0A182FL11_ANOAL